MSPLAAIAAFTAAAALLTIVPGLDTLLVLRTAAAEGPRRALLAGAGICLGCLVWGVAAAFGLGVLLEASHLAYTALKWAGACYLVFLGVQLLGSKRESIGAEPGLPTPRSGAFLWFRRGLVTNLLNPKVGIFYVSFLPQFIPAGVKVAPMAILLASIHALLGLAWFALLVAATDRLATALRQPRTIRILDRLTGLVFLGFGLRLALDRS